MRLRLRARSQEGKSYSTVSFVGAATVEEVNMHPDSDRSFFMRGAGQLAALFLTVVSTRNTHRASSIFNSSHNKILI